MPGLVLFWSKVCAWIFNSNGQGTRYLPKVDMDTRPMSKTIKEASQRFVKTPYWILTRAGLSDGAFRTYLVIRSFKFKNNKVFPSVKTLAIIRGKSQKAISIHLGELRDKKIIKTKRLGFSKSNLYTLIEEENDTNDGSIAAKNDASLRQNTTVQNGQKLPPNNNETKKIQINNYDKNRRERTIQLRKQAHKLAGK